LKYQVVIHHATGKPLSVFEVSIMQKSMKKVIWPNIYWNLLETKHTWAVVLAPIKKNNRFFGKTRSKDTTNN
jgi:hypothetical protein